MDKNLRSMKLTASEKKKVGMSCSPGPGTGPNYPYGLELSFDDLAIRKLGLRDKSLDIDTVVNIIAKAKVVSMSKNVYTGEESSTNMRLQITDMSVEPLEDK